MQINIIFKKKSFNMVPKRVNIIQQGAQMRLTSFNRVPKRV